MADNDKSEGDQQTQETTGQNLVIQKIYVKDISFEAPNTPGIFRVEWNPEVSLELNTNAQRLEEGVFEVVLSLTVTVKNAEQTAFLVEVQQAGIFTLTGFDTPTLNAMLGSYCPNILFPYAREAVSDTVTRGGFPQLLLTPVNFDALYAQHVEQSKQEQKGASSAKGEGPKSVQ
ncbi:MAG: protein-export chaperone SecB [Pseudomonadota bacterium]|nr:MAG: protein-export chaperone SecB [Pseudomonadota bacterium]